MDGGLKIPKNLRQAILLLLAVTFVPLLAATVFGFLEARSTDLRDAEERLLSLARIAQLGEQRLIANTRQTLFVLAQSDAVRHGDQETCSAALRAVMQPSLVYGNLGVADRNGDVVCSAQVMSEPVNVTDRRYFQRVRAQLDFAIGEYVVGRISGKPSLTFAYPVLNTRRTEAWRVVFAAVDLVWLGSRLRRDGLPPDGAAWVLDEEGRVLLGMPDGSWQGQNLAQTVLGRNVLAAGLEPVIARVEDIDGVERLYAIVPLWTDVSGPVLRLAIGRPVADVYVDANRTFAVEAGLLLLGTGLILVVTLVLLRRGVLRQLDGVVDATRRLAGGDLAARAPTQTRIAEFAHLGAAFNELADAIEVGDRALTRHVADLERLNRKFAVLSGTNQALVHATDETTLYRTICDVVIAHGVGEATWIGEFQDDDVELIAGAAVRDPDWPVAEGLRTVSSDERQRRLRGGHVVSARLDDDHVLQLPFEEAARRHCSLGYVAHPILRQGKPVAALHVYTSDAAFWMDRQGLDLMREMAGDIGFALANFDREAEVRRLAYHDGLTGLPNRNMFVRTVGQAIGRAAEQGLLLPIVKIELTSLNRRIDRFGHAAGDYIVRSFAVALAAELPPGASCARTGEEVFTIMLPGDRDAHDLRERVEGLLAGLPRRLQFGVQDIAIETAAGVACYPEDGDSPLALMRASLLALDTIRGARTGTVAFHSARLSALAHERWQIERALGSAIVRNELALEYQPVRSLSHGAYVGVEALLRWRNAELGSVSPGKFVPIAEQTGQIVALGYWVLEQACAQIERWHAEGVRPGYVSVNVSVLQLYDPSFVGRVGELLEACPAARGHLAVEVTETEMMDDFELTQRVLSELKALGIAVFVDDFGTGYSSLSYLRRLPADTLKIDISFVTEIGTSDEALSVVRAILALGRSLGLSTIAEGVETSKQAQILAEIGCDAAQGYLYGRPQAARSVADLLRAEGAAPGGAAPAG